MENITIDVGVFTSLTLDLSEFDFEKDGIERIVFTIKNRASVDAPELVEREFNTAGVHGILITPEESVKLNKNAKYDINKIMIDGKRYKITDNGNITLREGIGDAID